MTRKTILTKRDYYGEEFYKKLLSWYEEMRAFRNKVSENGRRPNETEILILKLNKPFEIAYKRMLSDD